MLTQCPNCQTTFRVTSEILRVADGQVRCGRCQVQFDALEGRHIEISGTYEVIDDTDRSERQILQEVTGQWVDLDDPDESAISGADAIGIGAEADSADDPQAAAPASSFDESEPFNAVQETLLQPAASTHADTAPDFDLSPRARRALAPVWKLLAAPLLLLLAVQAVHHSRSTLARHPRIGAALVSVYGALGLQLTPDWDLHAYELRQWGVISNPATPGTLKVRASITNLADFSQPCPLLKLVLEDRWGEPVRAREFMPAEYLDPGVAPNRLLAPAQKTNATIAIIDPGPDAEGFRFDVCLPGKRGAVCAEEVP